MRHLLITLGTAAAVVAAFLALRSTGARESLPQAPIIPAAPTARDAASLAPRAPEGTGPATVFGLPELEVLHRRHGAVGAAMRDFLAIARGSEWNHVDRRRMQEILHAIRSSVTEADIPYLVDLFDRTKDPAFRWWFSWLVQQVPDERFIDAMTDVYTLDARRGLEGLASINRPAASERFLRLLDDQADPALRRHAVVTLAHTDWENREEIVTTMARDAQRPPSERIEALTALGRMGVTADSSALLMEVALGPAAPANDLDLAQTKSHPVADVRSGAILAVMQRGDQELARRLIEAADAAGPESALATMVDVHVASFTGPDLSEFIYDRARRRGVVSAGEVHHLLRDLERVDRARLRDLLPLVRDPDAKALLRQVLERG